MQPSDGWQSLSSIDRELMLQSLNTDQNSGQALIIARVLQWILPRKKTMVNLVSAEDKPVEEAKTMSGWFYKVKWNVASTKTVCSDKVRITNGGLNVEVQSEDYYFLYARLQFKTTSPNTYGGVSFSYTINRQRGSTSTYIHEAKQNCRFTDASQVHSSVSELVVHLNKYDQIFVSVSSSDLKYLSSDDGAHIFGLFEL